jgi:hypothetical protein
MHSGDKVWWKRGGRRAHRVEATFLHKSGTNENFARIKLCVMGSEYIRTVALDTLSPIVPHVWPNMSGDEINANARKLKERWHTESAKG